MPAATWMWLQTVTAGFPLQGPEWEGWLFKNGKFISPEGVEIGTGQINALPYTYGRLRELEKQVSCNKAAANIIPLRPRVADLAVTLHRYEYRGRLQTIIRAIATLWADLEKESDDPELCGLAPGCYQLLEAASGHLVLLLNLTRQTSGES